VRMLLATTNRAKRRELMSMLAGLGIDLVCLDDSISTEEVETGSTFPENALLKARYHHKVSGLPTIADDSGLEVLALEGAPGIHSARYGGSDRTDSSRIARLLEELEGVPPEARGARFVCSAAIVWAGGELVFTEEVRGRILAQVRGESGFGYDPVFLYEPLGKTFAELPLDQKAKVSHRGLAFRGLARWLGLPGVLDRVASGDRINDPSKETSASVDKR
jgi:XTP/dITP diphosphohydrolase